MSSRKEGLDVYTQTLDAHPDAFGMGGVISSLAIAPIKSLGMLSLESATVTSLGLMTPTGDILDRSAMLARKVSGQAWQFDRFSQRDEPALALARPTFDGEVVTYHAPDMDPLSLGYADLKPANGMIVKVRMTSAGDMYSATLAPQQQTDWVRTFLRKHGCGKYDVDSLYVLGRPWGYGREVEERHSCGVVANTAYTDGGQLLVASESTLQWLNDQLTLSVADFQPLMMDAFRPNIVFNALPPNIEDTVFQMRSDGRALFFGGLCVRCPVTQVYQSTGKRRDDSQPLKGLKCRPARPPENAGVTFGVNCVASCAAASKWKLAVGETFVVQEEK